MGTPVEEARVSIIKITEEPLERFDNSLLVPQGEIGEILVEGKMVTASYHGRPTSTRLAKVRTASGIAHRMGDLGYFDEQGRLWFCGRKSHRVQIDDVSSPANGGTLFSVPCEMIFNAHPSVYRSALVELVRKGRRNAALCVELEPGVESSDKAKLRGELLALAAKHACTKPIREVFFHRGFPVDIRHNAKIDRKKLGVWARGRRS